MWIDGNINNGENKGNQAKLRDMNFELFALENENEGINEIKKIKFEKINLLISGSLFQNFINLIKKEKAEISCALNIIVFTSILGKSHIEEICNNDNDILNGLLFKNTNIFWSISDIQDFLLSLGNNESEKEEIFEKIERDEQILPHIYYQQFLKSITKEEIHNFNQYLINMHGMEELIGQFEDIPEMPKEIICKYWVNAYTLETSFYSVMRHKLQTKKGKFFCPYIKMMYEGVKIKALKPKYDQILYRGSIISLSELNILEQNLNESNESIFPKLILYYRGFQSFSLIRERAIDFMNKSTPPNNHIKVLFLVQPFNSNISTNANNQDFLIDGFLSNAYIKELSNFPEEEEVLFFPFSSFEVTKINREFSNHVEITLEYLGKYRQNININPQNILPFFQASEFGKEILELELINYKRKYSWNIEKEIYIEDGDVSFILYLENNLILFSADNIIKLYDIQENKNILDIKIHHNTVNDLLKVDNFKFISSSKDNTIKYFKLNDNYSNYNIIETISIHLDEVNQTIKLKTENYYASCSNDKKICIWSFEMNENENENTKFKLYKILIGHESNIISIFALSDNSIISVSRAGFLKIWDNDICIKSLELGETPLNHSISWYSENLIGIGTIRSIIFVDIIKKEIVFNIPINFTSTSFCNFYGNIILGLIENNYLILREFEILKNDNSFEFIAEGKDDKTLEISLIQIIDETTIITANKYKFIKIWKKGNIKMPKLKKSYSPENIIFTLEKEEEKKNIINDINNSELKETEKIEKIEKIEEIYYNKIGKKEKIEEIILKNKEKEKEKELSEMEMNLKQKEIEVPKEYDENELYKYNILKGNIKEYGENELDKYNILKGNIKEYGDNELDKYNILKGNKMVITIVDSSQSLHFSIDCNKNDKFIKIEELLYERYPKYKKVENYFLFNGDRIKRFNTLEENGIRDNSIILLYSLPV